MKATDTPPCPTCGAPLTEEPPDAGAVVFSGTAPTALEAVEASDLAAKEKP